MTTARILAQTLLLAQKPARLPVRVEKLRFDKRLVIDSLGHYCALTGHTVAALSAGVGNALRDGCTLVKQQKNGPIYVILYNEQAGSAGRRSFTLAHEVGHIYLAHTADDLAQEQEADAFAAELLMPQILAAEYLKLARGREDPVRALSQAFAVSAQMAGVGLSQLGRRGRVFTELERALLVRYQSALPNPAQPEVGY